MFKHLHLIKSVFNRELSEIYISGALRDLALSMAGIFVPIYLFVDLKYPFLKVVLFFLIYALSLALSSLLAAKFTAKYGIKHGILISMFTMVVYIILLATLPYHNLYILTALIWGASVSFYWVSFHADFAKSSDRRYRGQEVSIWFITSYFGILLGPILGSVIIVYLGFITLFVIVSLILLLSTLPLFLSSEIYEPVKFSYKYLFNKSHLKETYFYLIYGMRIMVGQLALPLFIFLLLGKYISLGAIASFATLGAMITGYFVGKFSKTEKSDKIILKYGSLFHSLGWFFILFVKTFVQIAIVNVYLAISFIFIDIPHYASMYTKARKEKNMMEYIVYRELTIGFGRVLGVLIILLTGKLVLGFILSGVGIFSWFFI
jgi:MFS transporter, YQGE family, putative transporter